VSLGKSIEGLADKSPIVQDLMQRYLGVSPRQDAPRQISEDTTDTVTTVTAAVVETR
jgi:hypothetical protein